MVLEVKQGNVFGAINLFNDPCGKKSNSAANKINGIKTIPTEQTISCILPPGCCVLKLKLTDYIEYVIKVTPKQPLCMNNMSLHGAYNKVILTEGEQRRNSIKNTLKLDLLQFLELKELIPVTTTDFTDENLVKTGIAGSMMKFSMKSLPTMAYLILDGTVRLELERRKTPTIGTVSNDTSGNSNYSMNSSSSSNSNTIYSINTFSSTFKHDRISRDSDSSKRNGIANHAMLDGIKKLPINDYMGGSMVLLCEDCFTVDIPPIEEREMYISKEDKDKKYLNDSILNRSKKIDLDNEAMLAAAQDNILATEISKTPLIFPPSKNKTDNGGILLPSPFLRRSSMSEQSIRHTNSNDIPPSSYTSYATNDLSQQQKQLSQQINTDSFPLPTLKSIVMKREIEKKQQKYCINFIFETTTTYIAIPIEAIKMSIQDTPPLQDADGNNNIHYDF